MTSCLQKYPPIDTKVTQLHCIQVYALVYVAEAKVHALIVNPILTSFGIRKIDVLHEICHQAGRVPVQNLLLDSSIFFKAKTN